MPSHRRVLALRLIVVLFGTLAMIAALTELKARVPVAREQRAIADLVKAGAGIQVHHKGDGSPYYFVSLAGCENCRSNDELLRYVQDIGIVPSLALAPLPLYEAGRKSLFRLKELRVLVVYLTDTGLSPETYAELKREMRLCNSNVQIVVADKNDKLVE